MHILLKFPETKKQEGTLVCSKWLNINEDIAYWKIISCTNVTMTKQLESIYLKLNVIGRPKLWGTPQPPPPPPRIAGRQI
jgi:hypothetical protein